MGNFMIFHPNEINDEAAVVVASERRGALFSTTRTCASLSGQTSLKNTSYYCTCIYRTSVEKERERERESQCSAAQCDGRGLVWREVDSFHTRDTIHSTLHRIIFARIVLLREKGCCCGKNTSCVISLFVAPARKNKNTIQHRVNAL